MSDQAAKDVLYGGDDSLRGSYGNALRDNLNRLQDATGMNAQQADAHLLSVAKFAYGANITPTEASDLHSLIVRHSEKPADDTTVQQWTMESRRLLREKYGDEAGHRLQAVNQYLANHPQMKDDLNRTGVGGHPRMVMALAERAMLLRDRSGKK